MKKMIIILAGIVCMALQSCITSLQPIVTKDTIIKDDRIIGHWQQDDAMIEIVSLQSGKMNDKWKRVFRYIQWNPQIEAEKSFDNANVYLVSMRKKEVDYYMTMSMTRINGEMFMDLFPILVNPARKPEEENMNYDFDFLPSFTIAKLAITANTMTIKFIDGEFIKQQVTSGKASIRHESNALFGTFLITASSTELQQFMSKYGQDDRLFSKENSITLTKRG